MTFVFYDTETTGTDTSFDQILQFAAIRTDNDFNEIDSFEIRCQLLPHVIPSPGALLATRVTPEMLTDSTLPSHYEACCKIADQLERWSPATFLGYNSISFDEKLLRQAFYQNLKPIYLTNTHGNRRGDILRLVDAAIVCAPDSIAIPLSAKGRITRRLDKLAPSNGFSHSRAHDAKADVEATIFLARLLRTRNPLLWDAIVATASKATALGILRSQTALALIESRYAQHHAIPITWCGQNPTYAAQVAVFDLRHDPANLLSLSTEQLVVVFKTPKSPLRLVQANAQPILVPLVQARLQIANCPSDAVVASRIRTIENNPSFRSSVGKAIADLYTERQPLPFVEQRIYEAFPSSSDMRLAAMFHEASWNSRHPILSRIVDDRIRELGLRLLGLEAENHLSVDEQNNFRSWLTYRRRGAAPERSFRTIANAISECLKSLDSASPDGCSRLRDILNWLDSLWSDASPDRKAC